MIKKIIPLLFLLSLLITGCTASGTESEFKSYLEEMEMNVVSIGTNEKVLIDEAYASLENKTARSIWAVQDIDVNDYIGKEIEFNSFIVENHPLHKMKPDIGELKVSLIVLDNEVIGGYTVSENGYYFSLDGDRVDVSGLYGN